MTTTKKTASRSRRSSRVRELTERVREQEGLVRALQAGEVDAVVVLQEGGATIARLMSDEPLYRTIVDTLPQGVATVLSNGTFVYVNQHLAKIIGSTPEALLGDNILKFVAERDSDQLRTLLMRAVTSPQEAGITFNWPDGEEAAVVSAIHLPISGVDAVGLVVVDVHDQVARKAAEESSRAKDDLIASVSHELRTPLTSIMGWIQLLEKELANEPRAQEGLRNLKNAVLAEAKIVDDLLDLSRFEKGVVTVAMTEFDLRTPLRVAASFVDLQARTKSINVQVTEPDDPLTVQGDPDRLRQVFVNLLSNAVKFTPNDGSITLRAHQEQRLIVVDVIDSGMGISKDFAAFVFEPFRRSDGAKSYPGLGIGLAISKRIVEAHGGSIEVTSDGPGSGSTFTVRLPSA